MKSHNLEKKSAKRRRGFRRDNPVDEGNTATVKKQLNL
jgi:ribosomal protein L35